MYGDLKTKHDRMKKSGGSASSKNLLGKMSSDKHEERVKGAMHKALENRKAKAGKADKYVRGVKPGKNSEYFGTSYEQLQRESREANKKE